MQSLSLSIYIYIYTHSPRRVLNNPKRPVLAILGGPPERSSGATSYTAARS